MSQKILFADDDPEIREVLRLLLTSEGYEVVEAADGRELLDKLDDSVGLVILVVMMPGTSGYAACAEIRNRSAVPVLVLTARYYVYGARAEPSGSVIRCCGNIEIDSSQCLVRQDGREINLTDTEYRILLLLASHPKKVFSVQNIYESVWMEPYFYSSNNTVMVHIRNIRRKLGDDPQNSRTIRTVWGKGYRIE